MSRAPILLLGMTLFSGVAWTAVTVTEIPAALAINGAIAEMLGHRVATANYADVIFTILCLVLAALIAGSIGWSLRGTTARVREADLTRRLNDTKARLPRLESGMRNKEMHVARVEQQMKNLEGLLPPLHKTIEEKDVALRDRDRSITLLKSELAMLKGIPLASDAPSAAMATLDLDDDPVVAPQPNEALRALEDRVAELQSTVREREARIADLILQGNSAERIPALQSELDGQRKRNEDFDRDRARQEEWLDVLNDQLARSRDTNDKLTTQLTDQTRLQQRVFELEGEVRRLSDEIADRERRLAASRFECATARTTITHLQAQLDAKKAEAEEHGG
jgi:chromosome segregation ATPase